MAKPAGIAGCRVQDAAGVSEAAVTCRDGCLRVEGDMTIYSAAFLKDELFSLAPACGENIELDLSAVSALDTAGLQVMLMLRRLAYSKGAAFRLRRPSAAAVEVLELCGMQELIPGGERGHAP